MFLSGLFNAPRWAITEDEAQLVASGFAKFARWYNFPELPEKFTDHYVFFLALATVYGTRAMAEYNEARKSPQPPIITVNPVPPQPGPEVSAGTTNSGREPPDPRNWRKEDVPGFGAVDIPPVVGNIN